VPPRRRCVGCGRIAPKSELLRIAAAPAQGSDSAHAVADPLARLPGRGAYLCRADADARPAERCLAQAERKGAIARALRRALPGGLVLNDVKLVESVGR
jgi:predicted RNA-binding protein YlxR (DUF448 family)